MKKIGLYIGLVIIGLVIGFWIKPTDSNSGHSHKQSTEQQVWTCSMHPQVRQNEPGKCPLCGMDLIPLNDDLGKEGKLSVKMSATAMQLASVVTKKVAQSIPKKEIRLNGKVALDESKIFTLSSHIPGRIEQLLVNYTGEKIEKGQVLAYVYSPELITAQEELFEAIKIKDKQASLYQASIEKLKNWKLTKNQIDQIIQEGKVQELFPILADESGVVIEKKVKVGDYIKRGQSIYVSSNLNHLWVLFDVYEKDLKWIKMGDEVQYEVQSLPGEKWNGTVKFIDPIVNARTRVAKARLEVANIGLRLKPDMFVSGTLSSPIGNSKELISIPKSAVMWTGKRSIVYIKDQTNETISFQMRKVELGSLIGDNYIVMSGLELGEEIAVHGTFSIDAAAQLAGKPSMMNVQEEQKHLNIQLSETAKIEVEQLLNQYISIKDKLVSDQIEGLSEDLKLFEEQLLSIDMSLFEGEAHHLWMMKLKSLKSSIGQLKAVNEIVTFRNGFVDFSNEVNGLVQAFGPFKQTYFIQRCPMANDDKGAEWLSKEKEVMNPYFGASMLRCGEVVHEIK